MTSLTGSNSHYLRQSDKQSVTHLSMIEVLPTFEQPRTIIFINAFSHAPPPTPDNDDDEEEEIAAAVLLEELMKFSYYWKEKPSSSKSKSSSHRQTVSPSRRPLPGRAFMKYLNCCVEWIWFCLCLCLFQFDGCE